MKKNKQQIKQLQNKNSKIYLLIVFCLPVLLYLQTFSFDFTHFDDNLIISNNATFLKNFENASHVFFTDAFLNKSSSFYRPLQSLSYMMDMQLSGINDTWMFHLSNILLLGLIACSIYILLEKFLIPAKQALIGTLVFCTHPLFVSNVAWIPARGDLMLTLFSLLSFLFFIELLRKKKIIYMFLNWVTFSIALFCKETAVLLPLIFILYFFTFNHEKQFDKKYFLIILLYSFSGICWFLLRSKAIGNYINPNDTLGFKAVILNLQTIPESLAMFIISFKTEPLPSFSVLKTIIGIAIIIALVILLFKNKERSFNEKIFCLAWFLILMLPPMLYKHRYIDYLEHRFFLPLIGILIFLLFIIPAKWLNEKNIKMPLITVVVIILLSSFTFIKSLSYSDPMTFYNSSISQNKNSAIAYFNRGHLKNDRNDTQGAIDDYTKAIAICPTYDDAYINRGNNKSNIGDKQGAIEDFNKAIEINPTSYEAYYNRGLANTSLGNFKFAIEDFNKTISINPKYAEAYNDRGIAKANINDKSGAIEDFNSAIYFKNDFSDAYCDRGIAFFSIGNFKAALADGKKALNLNPNDETASNLIRQAEQEIQKETIINK